MVPDSDPNAAKTCGGQLTPWPPSSAVYARVNSQFSSQLSGTSVTVIFLLQPLAAASLMSFSIWQSARDA